MRVTSATDPGNPPEPNEDWASATANLKVVLDGGTARTVTGCRHGVSWFAAKLGAAIVDHATELEANLTDALSLAIRDVADLHSHCDLNHPGTPSAAVGIVRTTPEVTEYLVLGDVLVLADTTAGLERVVDDRVDKTAVQERAEANRYPLGSQEKQAALLRMKHVELAARNTEGGYWIATHDPSAVFHAIRGSWKTTDVNRLAVLSDGAARIVTLFDLLDWNGLLDLVDNHGRDELIKRVRAIEAADPLCTRWPRNKQSDDATVVWAR